MKKKCTFGLAAIVFVTANFISHFSAAQMVRLSTGFDNYIGSAGTVPSGWYISWNSTSSPSYYFTAGNYGTAIPSYKFGITQDTVISPHFLSGDTLSFWCKGQGTPFSTQNILSILVSSDSITWNQFQNIDSLPLTATTLAYPLACDAHYVMFIYFKVNGNLAFDDVKVTMTNYSPTAVAATTLNLMCAGDSVCFFDMSTIPGCDSIASRIWNFGDGTPQDSSENPCHIFAQPGNYNVWLHVAASNGSIDSTYLAIAIFSLPSAQFSENNTNGTIVNFTDLSSITSGSIVNWYWDFGDQNYSTQQNPAHFYSAIGNYYACLLVYSNNGCRDSICDSVSVIGAGIEDYEMGGWISVAPNPSISQLTIENGQLSISGVEIFDALGQRVFSRKPEPKGQKQIVIDVSQLSEGIYFLKLSTDTKRYSHKIFIAR